MANNWWLPAREIVLHRFELNEDVKLNPDETIYNKGLRFISKILLNSFWGHLGMQASLPKTRYFNNYTDVIECFISNATRELDSTLVGNDLMYLHYKDIDDAADSARKTNVVLCKYTTAHVRTVLYGYMQRFKKTTNILFCDTDSLMYIDEIESPTRTQKRDIPLENNLGDMTVKIPESIEILKFYRGGPKFYCLSGFGTQSITD